jgi:hypothetical protein
MMFVMLVTAAPGACPPGKSVLGYLTFFSFDVFPLFGVELTY